jgi:hypothetical protein
VAVSAEHDALLLEIAEDELTQILAAGLVPASGDLGDRSQHAFWTAKLQCFCEAGAGGGVHVWVSVTATRHT